MVGLPGSKSNATIKKVRQPPAYHGLFLKRHLTSVKGAWTSYPFFVLSSWYLAAGKDNHGAVNYTLSFGNLYFKGRPHGCSITESKSEADKLHLHAITTLLYLFHALTETPRHIVR
jgi:hypothetical protein